MKYIIKDIPECKMKVITNIYEINNLKQLVKKSNLSNNVKFVGYSPIPEIYFKNASLHIFPTISESFGLVLSETKIYGIPNILLGLDYVSIAIGGTIIIYDESAKSIAKEAIKILKNYKYRKTLGREARISMKKFNNNLISQKWVKLILCIFNGDKYYNKLRNSGKKISEKDAVNILKRQIIILKKRNNTFRNLKINMFNNFTSLEKLKLNKEKQEKNKKEK